ncbi:LacI family DNA-binding transcriptional regulator [Thermoanaerobacterium sp. R66]|uniref:LacI family DNA-binding transcriptional regulator n=1 Tax=Thermoanaerobacterium sp. R66 TaxID=2742479 RepID=UPI0023808ABE|nr:LacI family DNA-binding transcriptional regulator [Thermoanaerobacterium sp. R66]MDE4542692.1 LacI family DNA-binding transcriptional regulator [Thermoanaerobacterium sp. R66]
MVNIRDVAKYCGVSAMTVSRALNNSGQISKETKERILKACEELGYRPNFAARSLVTKKTNMIGLIIPDITNQYYSQVSKGVSSYLSLHGYGLLLCNSDRKKEEEKRYLDFLAGGRVDGIIIFPVKPKKEDYEKILKEVPLVMADNYVDGLNANFVGNDNYHGASEIIRHMVKQGFKKIGVILGPTSSSASNERLRAYKDVLAENNMEYQSDIILESDATFDDGFNLAKVLIEKGVDSIFAINDTVALGVIKYCYLNNIKIPDDIGIAGYDNIQQSSMLPVPLTTVDQNGSRMGKVVAETMLNLLTGGATISKKIILKPQLVVRKSLRES